MCVNISHQLSSTNYIEMKRLRSALEKIVTDDKRQALGQQIKIDSLARAFSTDLYFLDGYLKRRNKINNSKQRRTGDERLKN